MLGFAIYTDLDHTMMGRGARVDGIPEVVETLEDRGVPVIPITAKSVYEIVPTVSLLGVARRSPLIAAAESGAAVYADPRVLPWSDGRIEVAGRTLEYVDLTDGTPLHAIDAAARRAFDRAGCRPPPLDVSSMDVEELSRITGLPRNLASLIRKRVFMKVYYHPDAECKRRAAEILEAEGFHVGIGRNFIHIGRHRGKGYALEWISSNIPYLSSLSRVALGDSEHDKPMLERADIAVVIPPEKGLPLRLSRADYIVAPLPAPEGWIHTVKTLLLNPGLAKRI